MSQHRAPHPKILIVGGGVGGLSAAHELAERGHAVTVLEKLPVLGGKARSIRKPGSGRDGRDDLPGEHGVRFFPGFYRHVFDTMSRIPVPGRANGVMDHMVSSRELLVLQRGGRPMEIAVHFPRSAADVGPFVRSLLEAARVDVPLRDRLRLQRRMLSLMTACPERRLAVLEGMTWPGFIGTERAADDRYEKYFARCYTHFMSAAEPSRASARTFGTILGQMSRALVTPGLSADMVLTGPTNDVWIDPWTAHLRSLGVHFENGVTTEAIDVRDGRIAGVRVRDAGGAVREETADLYVIAVPAEVMARLVTPALARAAPSLAHLDRLYTAFMGGVQFFTDRPLTPVRGHTHYTDAPWKLTARAQPQFWPGFDLERIGDGRVRDILSVSIADWHVPGTCTTDKTAMRCTAEEIQAEVWAQLLEHYDGDRLAQMRAVNVVDWHIDARIHDPATRAEHQEPLLINTAESWGHRPAATTAIDNLFLASDYVRTHTDIASMEAACEAGRRAANGVLDRLGAAGPRAGVWPLSEPLLARAAQAIDRFLYRRGINRPDLRG